MALAAMNGAVLLALALLATWIAERFIDAGVIVALLFGAAGLFRPGHPERIEASPVPRRRPFAVFADDKGALLSFVMPVAALFCIDREWGSGPIALYTAFIFLALVAAISTNRRNPLISAAIALVVIIIEVFLI
jgi:hypothetical protein